MARHPDWFARLDTITEVLRQADRLEWLGRSEIRAIFSCSDRESIRLLHKFGAEERDNSLSLPRPALLAQLQAVRVGSTYAAFLRQRRQVSKQLGAARAEVAARQFRVKAAASEEPRAHLENLPQTITWRRSTPSGRARFEILYNNGADLMLQIAEFLTAAGENREDFVAATEPDDGPR